MMVMVNRSHLVRARCREGSVGGSDSYRHVAHTMYRSLVRLEPYDLDHAEWTAEIDKLDRHIDRCDSAAVWEWFNDRYPNVMQLVPKRKHDVFVRGVCEAREEGW